MSLSQPVCRQARRGGLGSTVERGKCSMLSEVGVCRSSLRHQNAVQVSALRDTIVWPQVSVFAMGWLPHPRCISDPEHPKEQPAGLPSALDVFQRIQAVSTRAIADSNCAHMEASYNAVKAGLR